MLTATGGNRAALACWQWQVVRTRVITDEVEVVEADRTLLWPGATLLMADLLEQSIAAYRATRARSPTMSAREVRAIRHPSRTRSSVIVRRHLIGI